MFAHTFSLNRKFFGNPNAPKALPKQSKLSFSSKSTSNGASSSSASKENEDIDMEDAIEKEVTPKVEEDTIAKKENVKPGTGRFQCGKPDIIC
jgi:DNA ligase-1